MWKEEERRRRKKKKGNDDALALKTHTYTMNERRTFISLLLLFPTAVARQRFYYFSFSILSADGIMS
jgi:hypothetical protein